MKQPEALRLADELDVGDFDVLTNYAAAAELRLLHEANQAMLDALKVVQGHIRFGQDLEQIDLLLSSAIAKATGE